MSTPVVMIGRILLIPSFLGMAIGLFVLYVLPYQLPAGSKEARDIAGGILDFIGFGIVLSSLVGGLLGWLLVMKKKILQCPACSTVIAAS